MRLRGGSLRNKKTKDEVCLCGSKKSTTGLKKKKYILYLKSIVMIMARITVVMIVRVVDKNDKLNDVVMYTVYVFCLPC